MLSFDHCPFQRGIPPDRPLRDQSRLADIGDWSMTAAHDATVPLDIARRGTRAEAARLRARCQVATIDGQLVGAVDTDGRWNGAYWL